jgi:hypothetical protein
MWLLNSFWRTLVAGTVLLGLLYIPSDSKGLPQPLGGPLGFLVTYKESLILVCAVALTVLSENHIRTYWWCSPARIGRAKMAPERWTARCKGASFCNAKCVRA